MYRCVGLILYAWEPGQAPLTTPRDVLPDSPRKKLTPENGKNTP